MGRVRKIGVYKITCNITGMSYIGQSNDVYRRLRFYKSLRCRQQPRIYRSLSKYGIDNHIFTIIWESTYSSKHIILQKDTLNILEKFYIFKYNTLSPNGLNLYSGGDSYTASEETRLKLSKSKSGINHPMYGKIGKLNPASKEVVQLSKDGEFIKDWESATVAEKTLNIARDLVSACCREDRYSTNGYIWMWKADFDTYGPKIYKLPKRKDSLSKKTYQYDLQGKYLREWNSTMDIERELNIANTSISNVCTNQKGQAGGFQWRYFINENGINEYITKGFHVVVTDIDTGLIQEFESLAKISKTFKIKWYIIKECCEGIRKYYKNYKFSYKY